MFRPAIRSRIGLTVVAVIAAGAWALSFAASAPAGSYTVYSCLRPVDLSDAGTAAAWDAYESSIDIPDEWQNSMREISANGVTKFFQGVDRDFVSDCGGQTDANGVTQPGSITARLLDAPTSAGSSLEAGLQFSAPPGTSITGFRIARRVDVTPSIPFFNTFYAYFKLTREGPGGSTLVTLLCPQYLGAGCGSGNGAGAMPGGIDKGVSSQSDLQPGETQRVQAVVGCKYVLAVVNQPAPCPEAPDHFVGQLTVRSMQFQLNESEPPALSNVGGSLIDDLGGSLAGVKTLNFHASDGQSGVYRATIEFDNEPVVRKVFDENAATCRDAGVYDANDFEFDARVPCKQDVDGALQLDTGQLHEGTHTLRAYVEDAAGNRTTLIPTADVLVSQSPNVAVRSCEPCNGEGGDPRSGRIVIGDPRSKLRVKSGKRVTLDGSLVASSGAPITGAQIDVLQRVHLPRESFKRVNVVTTDARGLFSFKPGTTSSRTVRFGFAPRRGSDNYSSSSDTELIVSGTISLRAKKHRLASFGALRLRGRISASPLDRGVPLQIQARDGRRWRTIAVTHTTQQGLFSFRYRFRHVPSGRFQFRALASESSDLPIEPTTSRPVTVTVGRR